jgi:hypothetical protein
MDDGILLSTLEYLISALAVESLRGRMSEAERQVNGMFESLLQDALA